MEERQKLLLSIDGLVNLVLGVLLLLFPFGIAEIAGVPESSTNFYATILGGVIFGIGLALVIERYGYAKGIRGLGLGGAIVINFCGALVLIAWLIISPPVMPVRGHILLWAIAVIVLGIGIIEALSRSWMYQE